MFNLKKKSLVYFFGVVLSLLLICGLIPALRAPLLNISEYPLKFLSLIKNELSGIVFYHRNFVQNERMKKEADLLRQKINSLRETALENARLKNILRFKQKSSYKVIAAAVIGRSPDSWSSIIIIDKGSSSGIRPGMAVITYLGLTGRVIETTESAGKIMLINDPDFGVSAVVQRSRQEGLVSGTLGNNLIMRYLPKDADIKVSDMIVTSGLTGKYIKGLLIGRVVEIGDEFSGLSRYCLIKPAVSLSNIEEVLIIIP